MCTVVWGFNPNNIVFPVYMSDVSAINDIYVTHYDHSCMHAHKKTATCMVFLLDLHETLVPISQSPYSAAVVLHFGLQIIVYVHNVGKAKFHHACMCSLFIYSVCI